jgi:molybdenum cofactor synthesis domain-containing protein
MPTLPEVILLAVGNELLNGEIRDRNLYTLARRLTRLGFQVAEAGIIRDDPKRIARWLKRRLRYPPGLVIISGGLGPTEDDLTLQAVATALERPLQETTASRALVEQHYDRLLAAGHIKTRGPTEARHKLALLPRGARSLPNPLGTAPGVEIEHDATRIYCLPGVPAELKAIFNESIVPTLRRRFTLGTWVEAELVVRCQDEAQVAAPLREVADRHPETYIKSLARPFPEAGEGALRILISAHAEDETAARAHIRTALQDLRQTLSEANIAILETE